MGEGRGEGSHSSLFVGHRNHAIMKRALPIHIALTLSAFLAHSQGTLLYDQQSATNRDLGGGGAPIELDQPMGQSFTPTLSLVGFVQMEFFDFHPGNGIGATVYVNLRAGSITGPILGSSAPVSMPDGFQKDITGFSLATPVVVTPGTTYYFQPVTLLGSDDQWDVVVSGYNYPGGQFIFAGTPQANLDFWFREGIVTPEPSAAVLVLLASGAFACLHRAHSKNHSIT